MGPLMWNESPSAEGLSFHINGPIYRWLLNHKDFSDLNRWIHIAYVRTGDELRLYRDGEFITASPIGGAFPNVTADLVIGSSEDAFFFKGEMHFTLEEERVFGRPNHKVSGDVWKGSANGRSRDEFSISVQAKLITSPNVGDVNPSVEV